MNYRFFGPSVILQDHIACFWSLDNVESGTTGLTVKTLVDNTSGIVFQHNNGESTFYKNGQQVREALVFGQANRSTVSCSYDPFTMVTIQFKPWALHELFGINANELTNELVDLNEFANNDINEQLIYADSADERVQLLTKLLLDRISNKKEPDWVIRQAIDMICQNPTISVGTLLKEFKLSDRQFERRFKQTVGVTPVFFIRVERFKEALRRIKSGHYQKLSDVAYALEYADQSHFIKDFRSFTGDSPSQFMSQHIADSKMEKFWVS